MRGERSGSDRRAKDTVDDDDGSSRRVGWVDRRRVRVEHDFIIGEVDDVDGGAVWA